MAEKIDDEGCSTGSDDGRGAIHTKVVQRTVRRLVPRMLRVAHVDAPNDMQGSKPCRRCPG